MYDGAMRRSWLLLLLLAACGGPSPAPAAPAPTPAPTPEPAPPKPPPDTEYQEALRCYEGCMMTEEGDMDMVDAMCTEQCGLPPDPPAGGE